MPNKARLYTLDSEAERLACEASKRRGQSVDQYVSDLISCDAEAKMTSIVLNDKDFDQFVVMCSKKVRVGDRLRKAAQRLDTQGYQGI